MNGILHKNTYKIKPKVTYANRYLDGGYKLILEVTIWNSGEPHIEQIELFRDSLGEVHTSEVFKYE